MSTSGELPGSDPQHLKDENKRLEERAVSRRHLLRVGAVVVGGIAAGIAIPKILGEPERPSVDPTKQLLPQSAYDSSDREHYPDQLTGVIGQGMAEKWQQAAVFPGMMEAAPGTQFFKDAFLTQPTDLTLQGNRRALIVRPVFPGQSLAIDTGVEYDGADLHAIQQGGIDSDTFSFFAPGFDSPLYANYAQSIESINLHTRLRGGELAYSAQSSSNLPLQFISIDGRYNDESVIIPMTERSTSHERIGEYEDPENYQGYHIVGTQKVTTFSALAQGRVYDSPSNVSGLIDGFYNNQEIIRIEPQKGPVEPIQNP